jgi:predicted DCC family thiol-disulfide oxidoreductase YuxK
MSEGPVILFDGVCNFCSQSVQFILKRDRRRRFRFASLQSGAARGLLARCAPAGPVPDAIVLIHGDRCWFGSTAALRIAVSLGSGWRLLGAFWIVPRPVRDWFYRWFAARRYRWFGKRDACYVPGPGDRSRFLDQD